MKLDETEVNILKKLQKNARISFRKLAKEINLSTPTISSKISKLENMGVIEGYHAKINPDKIAQESYIFNIKIHPKTLQKNVELLQKIKNVRKIYEIDKKILLITLDVKDTRDLDKFLEKIRKIKGIKDFEFGRITKRFKEKNILLLSKTHPLNIQCYYCNKNITDEPTVLFIDGRKHYLCCEACADLYKKKYKKLKEKAE